MEEMEDFLRDTNGTVVVAGDFNAKAVEWGAVALDARGKEVLNMAARIGLIVANVGTVSTFRWPGYGQTIPDITLVSETWAREVTGWTVLEDYTGSDHRYITFKLGRPTRQFTKRLPGTIGWNVNQMNEETLTAVVEFGRTLTLNRIDSSINIVETTMALLKQACDANF